MTIHFIDGTNIHVAEKTLTSCEAFGSLGFYATKTVDHISIVVFYTAIKYIS